MKNIDVHTVAVKNKIGGAAVEQIGVEDNGDNGKEKYEDVHVEI